MDQLLEAISALVAQVSPEKVQSLSSEVSELEDIDDLSKLTSWANTPTARRLFDDLVVSCKESQVSGEELAVMLVASSHSYRAAKKEESVELVWTGPSTGFISTRRTEQALLEVIQASKIELFIMCSSKL